MPSETFNIQGTVNGFPQKKKGKKGIFWNISTNVGKVNIYSDEEPTFEEGILYFFKGNKSTFDGEDGEPITMKWVEDWGKVKGAEPTKKTQENSQQTQKQANPIDPTMPLNGAAQGMIMNNSVLLVTSILATGTTKTDPASIKADIEYWNEYLEKMVRSGKLYTSF